jgi:hypothetical protein
MTSHYVKLKIPYIFFKQGIFLPFTMMEKKFLQHLPRTIPRTSKESLLSLNYIAQEFN